MTTAPFAHAQLLRTMAAENANSAAAAQANVEMAERSIERPNMPPGHRDEARRQVRRGRQHVEHYRARQAALEAGAAALARAGALESRGSTA